jgi:hypothetical protein
MTDPAALPNFGPAFPVSPPPPSRPGSGSGPVEWTSVDVRANTELPLPLRERVLRALAGGGYQAELDDDGDIEVSVQEQTLFVRCADTVPPLMRVFGQWLMDDLPADELDRLRAANAVTAAVNLAKATVHGDRLEVAVAAGRQHGRRPGLRAELARHRARPRRTSRHVTRPTRGVAPAELGSEDGRGAGHAGKPWREP